MDYNGQVFPGIDASRWAQMHNRTLQMTGRKKCVVDSRRILYFFDRRQVTPWSPKDSAKLLKSIHRVSTYLGGIVWKIVILASHGLIKETGKGCFEANNITNALSKYCELVFHKESDWTVKIIKSDQVLHSPIARSRCQHDCQRRKVASGAHDFDMD